MILKKKNYTEKRSILKKIKMSSIGKYLYYLHISHFLFREYILQMTLNFWFNSCFGSRYSSINFTLKKKTFCISVYNLPNTSFSGDKYIWKLSVFLAKPYDKPILREVNITKFFSHCPKISSFISPSPYFSDL